MKKAIPDEDRDRVIALIESGKTDKDIATLYKCCYATAVIYRVKVCGIKRKRGYHRNPGEIAGLKGTILENHKTWVRERKPGTPLHDDDWPHLQDMMFVSGSRAHVMKIAHDLRLPFEHVDGFIDRKLVNAVGGNYGG